MEPQEFTLETFEAAIRQQEKPVIVNFWAAWSVACIMNRERIEVVAELCEEIALCGYVNIDVLKELTERFSIITIPTTLVFYKEHIVKQYMGIQEPEILQAAVLDALGLPLPEQKSKE